MTTTDDLVALVERHPTNPIVCGMLLDHLYGDVGLSFEAAEARVREVVAAARTAAQIHEAAALLVEGGRRRWAVLQMIHYAAGVPEGESPTVVVVAGDSLQIGTADRDGPVDRYWGQTVISVGAAWLLRRWATHVLTLPQYLTSSRPPRPRR